ncbi:unnamed protein product [Knipowitschia caucasica]|uniref:Coiled-coil domain-containing protein 30 n=1 Tax=Knipowitschia caucasica TaxID=637954 RepID=A0AAV2M839_KNICA
MAQTEAELAQICSWLTDQGLSPAAGADQQLCCLWRALLRAQGNLRSINKTLDSQQSQYTAEICKVRKSLEQIRVFTGHKDVLAQEVQEENDQLRDQLQRLVSLQDLQISEVAKMLYDQGLTELVHSSPSEQVAYLLVERASLLETSEGPQTCSASVGQTTHKRALRHSQSPWKKLLGLNKSQKCLIPPESKHLAEQTNSVQKECFRLERDLEEGSRRLATAHNEIRRLTDELESAHHIQKTYEPELKAAKREVNSLRQEVQQLKKYEMMSLRKAKELNDALDHELQCLRSRVRTMEAERGPREHETTFLSVQIQTEPTAETQEVNVLRPQVEQLRSVVQQQRIKAEKARELEKILGVEAKQVNERCQNLQVQIDAQIKRLLEQESEIEDLKMQLERKENEHREQLPLDVSKTCYQLLQSSENYFNHVLQKDDGDFVNVCTSLKKQICESLKCFDQERRTNHKMQQKLKLKLSEVKVRLKDEMKWRDEKTEELERELSLCSHALTMEKELNMNVMQENDKLLMERRRLLQQLNEEVINSHKNIITALQSRVDSLELENRELKNRIVDLSTQTSSMERSLRNVQSLRAAEELRNTCDLQKTLTQLPPQTCSFLFADGACRSLSSLEGVESWSQCSSLARSGEMMGYLNLNSHNHSLLSTTDSSQMM